MALPKTPVKKQSAVSRLPCPAPKIKAAPASRPSQSYELASTDTPTRIATPLPRTTRSHAFRCTTQPLRISVSSNGPPRPLWQRPFLAPVPQIDCPRTHEADSDVTLLQPIHPPSTTEETQPIIAGSENVPNESGVAQEGPLTLRPLSIYNTSALYPDIAPQEETKLEQEKQYKEQNPAERFHEVLAAFDAISDGLKRDIDKLRKQYLTLGSPTTTVNRKTSINSLEQEGDEVCNPQNMLSVGSDSPDHVLKVQQEGSRTLMRFEEAEQELRPMPLRPTSLTQANGEIADHPTTRMYYGTIVESDLRRSQAREGKRLSILEEQIPCGVSYQTTEHGSDSGSDVSMENGKAYYIDNQAGYGHTENETSARALENEGAEDKSQSNHSVSDTHEADSPKEKAGSEESGEKPRPSVWSGPTNQILVSQSLAVETPSINRLPGASEYLIDPYNGELSCPQRSNLQTSQEVSSAWSKTDDSWLTSETSSLSKIRKRLSGGFVHVRRSLSVRKRASAAAEEKDGEEPMQESTTQDTNGSKWRMGNKWDGERTKKDSGRKRLKKKTKGS